MKTKCLRTKTGATTKKSHKSKLQSSLGATITLYRPWIKTCDWSSKCSGAIQPLQLIRHKCKKCDTAHLKIWSGGKAIQKSKTRTNKRN